ncbi:hypothetical protein [Pantoea sp. Taur]|uniref:hypothetical protein n=1 Tax=Pantoea sp. Taur TaxID=2576757 RepID=UPI0013522CE5|nr:hypothetical protein [Pantoea sp. Taur]MXP61289.1 hypothetical protein [Pantoea sp. Taur]
MSGKYYYAVRRGRTALQEVHCAGCVELAEAGGVRFIGTFYSLRHALQSARLRHPDCVICLQR